jgi:hypothetical protein
MPSGEGVLNRIKARIRALTPGDWLGKAGESFRRTLDAINTFSREHVRLEDRIKDTPDLLWNAAQGAANEKLAKAQLAFAEGEDKRIESELRRRTLVAKVRQELASASNLESQARIQQIKEVDAIVDLYLKLRSANVMLCKDPATGLIHVSKAADDFDWEMFRDALLLLQQSEEHGKTTDRAESGG